MARWHASTFTKHTYSSKDGKGWTQKAVTAAARLVGNSWRGRQPHLRRSCRISECLLGRHGMCALLHSAAWQINTPMG